MRASLQVVMINLQHAAYQSTPGALIKDYGAPWPEGKGPQGEYLRPTTEAEAAKRKPDFERWAAELCERDPGTYTAWRADFEFWRSGDVTVHMPNVDWYANREDGLICFRDHRLINTRETVPYFDQGTAFAYECRRCGLTTHHADFINTPRCQSE